MKKINAEKVVLNGLKDSRPSSFVSEFSHLPTTSDLFWGVFSTLEGIMSMLEEYHDS